MGEKGSILNVPSEKRTRSKHASKRKIEGASPGNRKERERERGRKTINEVGVGVGVGRGS